MLCAHDLLKAKLNRKSTNMQLKYLQKEIF